MSVPQNNKFNHSISATTIYGTTIRADSLLVDNIAYSSKGAGFATLVAGVAAVVLDTVTENSIIEVTFVGLNASPALGVKYGVTVTAGSGFSISSLSAVSAVVATDVSKVMWRVIKL